MGLLITLQRLLSLGTSQNRPSLVQFAIHDYHPTNPDPQFRMCWGKLTDYLRGADVPDAALTGLHSFLSQVEQRDQATICLSLNCDVSFDVSQGTLCMDSHDEDVACCSSTCMIDELDTLIGEYDARFK